MTQFILAVDKPTSEQRSTTTELIKGTGAAWWHWYADLWLISDRRGRSFDWWYDQIRAIEPRLRFLLFEHENGSDWNGINPKGHYKWMREYFPKSRSSE